jgi:hypothetical protein
MLRLLTRRGVLAAGAMVIFLATRVGAEAPSEAAAKTEAPKVADDKSRQAELDAAFTKMLSGATLEGSFTSTGEGQDPTKLSSDKYTLGEVKKLEGNYWMIPARIQYADKDFTVPLMLPVKWAGDTPVIVVDDVGLPGFGTVSARVMFFADHYAGYWKHGKHGGHLFGTISHDERKAVESNEAAKKESSPSGKAAAGEQEKKQSGQQ